MWFDHEEVCSFCFARQLIVFLKAILHVYLLCNVELPILLPERAIFKAKEEKKASGIPKRPSSPFLGIVR
jgi:hypothetical protein